MLKSATCAQVAPKEANVKKGTKKELVFGEFQYMTSLASPMAAFCVIFLFSVISDDFSFLMPGRETESDVF